MKRYVEGETSSLEKWGRSKNKSYLTNGIYARENQ